MSVPMSLKRKVQTLLRLQINRVGHSCASGYKPLGEDTPNAALPNVALIGGMFRWSNCFFLTREVLTLPLSCPPGSHALR